MQDDKYKHLPDGFYQILQHHIQDIAQLLTASFSRKNIIWNSANLETKALKDFFMKNIKESIAKQQKASKIVGKKLVLNIFFVERNRLTGCHLGYDIEIYRQMKKQVQDESSSLPFYRILNELGSQLQEKIDLSAYKHGECLVIGFGSHSTNNQATVVPTHVGLVEIYNFYEAQGYRYIMGRVSSAPVQKVQLTLGSKIISKIMFPIKPGKESSLFFFVLDMQNDQFVKAIQENKTIRSSLKPDKPKL